MSALRYLENVVTLKYDSSKCDGCRKCVEVCPHAVFVMVDKRARIEDLNGCMECGACDLNCAAKAISVKSGVGCASGIIAGMIRGTEPTCDCSSDSSCC